MLTDMDFVDGAEEGAFVAVEIIREIVQQLLVALQAPGG
jgi:spore maturation protein SpmB